jgi:hypothetical protein
MNKLDSIVPPSLREKARPCGSEFVYHYRDVLEVIRIATQNSIAILGSEFFSMDDDGLLTQAISGYELHLSDNWVAFVRENNELALSFVEQNQKEGSYGFILTSTSEEEFSNLAQRI